FMLLPSSHCSGAMSGLLPMYVWPSPQLAIRHASVQSPVLLLSRPRSHSSLASGSGLRTPSPQPVALQALVHPSKLSSLASSQASLLLCWVKPSPQKGSWQVEVHEPSSLLASPSSHCSSMLGWTKPSPHSGSWQAIVQVPVLELPTPSSHSSV